MNQLDNIMTLADLYATQRQHAHYLHETDARQALRAAIEQSLKDVALSAKHGTPGEPTYSIKQVDRAYELGLSEGKKDAPQPQPKQEPVESFSDFVRSASPERKAEVFERVAKRACEMQQQIIAPQPHPDDTALLRQALEALENWKDIEKGDAAIAALRERLK